MCALVAAVRTIPLMRPDGGPLGQEGRLFYNIMMTNEEADKKLSGIRADEAASRIDALTQDASDIGIDLSDVQGDSGKVDFSDQEERIRTAMEEAEKRKAEKVAREAEELNAMAVMGKLPAH